MKIKNGPRLKLARGKHHTDELQQDTQPLNKKFFDICTKQEGSYYNLGYYPNTDIAEALSVVIGDALSNYRSALDQLASNIARHSDPNAKIYFPITTDRKDMINNRDFKLLEAALPGAADLIMNVLRPDNNPNDWLWKFSKINNDDKHNDPIPNVAVTEIKNINLKSHGITMTNCAVDTLANQQAVFISSPFKSTFSRNYSVDVNMTFGDVGPDAPEYVGRDVIKTLRDIHDMVENTINKFEELVKSSHP